MPLAIPIQCMVCNASVKENLFPQHMASVHAGLSQSEAMAQEKNIPVQQSPIVLDKEAPPSQEFMEVAKMLDEKSKPSPTPPVVQSSQKNEVEHVSEWQEELKPIKLEYRYSGQCEKCRVPVETLVVTVKGQTVAVAFCIKHGQLAEREVADLEEETVDSWNTYEEKLMGRYDPVKEIEKMLTKKEGVKKHE